MNKNIINTKLKILILLLVVSIFMQPLVFATEETMNVTLTIEESVIPPESEELGINQTLQIAGQGLSGFLTAVTNPVSSFLLIFGLIIGILVAFYGIIYLFKNSFDSISFEQPNRKPQNKPSYLKDHYNNKNKKNR